MKSHERFPKREPKYPAPCWLFDGHLVLEMPITGVIAGFDPLPDVVVVDVELALQPQRIVPLSWVAR